MRTIRVLGISGSLRRASSNSEVIKAAALLVGTAVELVFYEDLATLPPFNPDVADQDVPFAIVRFRQLLRQSDAVLLSSPEYAHGVPGVLKNALDWVVGSGELDGKPMGVVNASVRATHASASLHETLTVMSARLVPGASVTIPVQGRNLDATGIAADRELSEALRGALERLIAAARERGTSSA